MIRASDPKNPVQHVESVEEERGLATGIPRGAAEHLPVTAGLSAMSAPLRGCRVATVPSPGWFGEGSVDRGVARV